MAYEIPGFKMLHISWSVWWRVIESCSNNAIIHNVWNFNYKLVEMSRWKQKKKLFLWLSCLYCITFNLKSNIQTWKNIDLEMSVIIFIKFRAFLWKFHAISRRSHVVAARINLSLRKVSLTSRSSRTRHFARSVSQTLRRCAFYSWLTARRTSWFIYEGARHFPGDVWACSSATVRKSISSGES